MTDPIWYYVDRGQQRRGPVSADAVAAAFRAGEALETSLVWREGLADWRPLAEFRDELGIGAGTVAAATVAPPPVPPPAPLPPAAAAPKSRGCLLIALALGGLVVLGAVGILAAVAVPQYRLYVARAGVATAIAEARGLQDLVDDFVLNTDRCPRDGDEVALPAPTSTWAAGLALGEAHHGMCTIELTLGGAEAGDLAGSRIVLSRDSAGDWYCTSDITRPGVLPADCD